MARVKILVADDDPDVRAILRITLEQDYEVLIARDGLEAWRMVREHRPRILLTDLNMPGLNGQQLTDQIREDPSVAGTIVIILTGTTAGDDLPPGFWRLGTKADLYLEKPVQPTELMVEVRRQLMRSSGVAPLPPGQGYYPGFAPPKLEGVE